ncbi:hypothetical protein N8988_08285 [Opitutales bacterium]|nr:hypothetical protein [Opitutales bacterium]
MNTTIRKFTYFLTASLLGCLTGHAYEQDNWYLAWEIPVNAPYGVETWENNNTGVEQIYLCNGTNAASKISVYDLNGSLSRNIQIANSRNYAVDLVIDENGTLFISERYSVTCISNDGTFKWRLGKGASISNPGSSGSLGGEFHHDPAHGVGIGILGSNLYVTDYYNHRIQVLDVNGTYKGQFSSHGTAPGTIQHPMDLDIIDDEIIVASRVTDYLNIFAADGSFLNRFQIAGNHQSHHVSVFQDTFVYRGKLYSQSVEAITQGTPLSSSEHRRYAFTSSGDLVESGNNLLRLWKRAYRTKGLPQRNVIPQPAIRKVAQRTGTNVLDLDFEIIDSDDNNATVGIIAYCGNDKVVPSTWVDGTGSKINSPIATNQVHRVSWDVKQDWNTSTGEIKFEILCQDGRTNKPVDLHFLTLPFSDGNLTISRSPLKDSDFQNYAKYLLAKGDAQFASTSSTAVTYAGSQIFTSAWGVTAAGRSALLTALGSGYRWATTAEVTKAREAATPGAVNNWTASVQVKPRNLPGKVNEYGFDVSTTSGYWVVKE